MNRIFLSDIDICRKLFNRAKLDGNESCPASDFNVRMDLDPSDRRRKAHLEALHSRLNCKENVNLLHFDLWDSVDKWLPKEGKSCDLYSLLVVSLLDALSHTNSYFGLKNIGAGTVLDSFDYWDWHNAFGECAVSSCLSEDRYDQFVNETISYGRYLIANNCSNSIKSACITSLFFAERGLTVPISIGELETLENSHPEAMVEIYFELATRTIRGTRNIAYSLSYALAKLCNSNEFESVVRDCRSMSSHNDTLCVDKSKTIRNFVYEVLRVYPPVAMVGRNTKKDCEVDLGGGEVVIPKNTHVTFDIETANRNLCSKGKFFDESFILSGQGVDLQSKTKQLATFGAYTYRRCPANWYVSEFILNYIVIFFKFRDLDVDCKTLNEKLTSNKKLEVFARITSLSN